MTDPPVQGFSRFIAIDIHKHYLMIGGIDAQQQIVLQPRNVELHRWLDWAKANLHPSDSASTRSTTSEPRRRVFHIIGVPPSVGRMLLATIGSSTKSRNALRNRAPAKRAVTMRPFRDVVAVAAAMVV
jgi:hypothetical protein